MKKKISILLASPVRQNPKILLEFLGGLEELVVEQLSIDFYFIDDNEKTESTKILQDFQDKIHHKDIGQKVILEKGDQTGSYICTNINHQWNNALIWKVAAYKNQMIRYALEKAYDYLFLIDSDLVLHPKTVKKLVAWKKDIISEIFWTKWHPNVDPYPQVWMYDEYSYVKNSKEIDSDEVKNILQNFHIPGIYKVGGLGACTLISRNALEKGVNYNPIYNLSFWGEDRHFSIRAAALGMSLFVDTTYPAYHIYRLEDLEGVGEYKQGRILYPGQNRWEEEVFSTIQRFIKEYLNWDYRILTGFEGISYLSQKLKNVYLSTQPDWLQYAYNYKLKVKTEVLDGVIEQFQYPTVKCNVKIKLNGTRIDGNIESNYRCSLQFSHKGKEWKIEALSFVNSDGQELLGFRPWDLVEPKIRVNKSAGNKLTLSMVVRNEAGNYLERVLEHAGRYIDQAVILDDASEDDTVALCKKNLENIPLYIESNQETRFHEENNLRKQLWEMTTAANPDWILCLDGDEIFEDRMIDIVHLLMDQPSFDFYQFPLYDMWDELHYREDEYWYAHRNFRPLLVRYQPNFEYKWNEIPQHCGRFPNNINFLRGCQCTVRLKHYGWAKESIRKQKYKRYLTLDPEGKYGNMNQYRSILDPYPNLKPWEE